MTSVEKTCRTCAHEGMCVGPCCEGESWRSIFRACASCGREFKEDDLTEDGLCPDCAEDGGICEECGCYFENDELDENGHCRFCAEELAASEA